MQAEQQRIKEVQSSFQVLHRWTDKSWGEGFDVLVFPKCLIALDPNDPSSSKIIAFSHDTKVHPFYKRNSECCEETLCGAEIHRETSTSTKRESISSPPSAVSSVPKRIVSELRISVRDNSVGPSNQDPFLASPNDVVLRWVTVEDKWSTFHLMILHFIAGDAAADVTHSRDAELLLETLCWAARISSSSKLSTTLVVHVTHLFSVCLST